MRKITAIILLCITALTACDKAFINGDLDGMWKLQQVESATDTHRPTDIYYSFQRHLTFISKHYEEKQPIRYLGNLHYNGDTIIMSGFRKFLEEQIAASPEILKQFYLYDDSTKFIIDKLDDETLIMKDGERRYSLRKW
jgi:hypothetical protein